MATTTARTPTIPRHTNLNPKPPTRINKVAKPPPRGDTPRFSLPGLASFTGTPQLPVPSISRDSLHRNTIAGPSHSRQQLNPQGMATNSRKRVVNDVLDLTHTTTADVDDSDSDEGPSQKRSRTALDPKRKSVKRAEQRAEKHDKLVAESAQWRTKYKKAFPSFTFYFDALDPLTEASLSKSVERLGASVDNFFSKKVTHVVTSRQIPSAASGKENQHSPSVSASASASSASAATAGAGGMLDSAAGPSRTKKQSTRSPTTYSLLNGQKLRPFGEGLDKNPFIDSQDILSKAVEFKLKIWHLEKIQAMLTRINAHSPKKADTTNQRNLSLPSLLRDEQVYGTRERDPFVLRPDMHYFDRKSCHILVEDSTGEHRPIVTKEYERPRKHEDPSWPVLWGGIEGRGGFYHYNGPITYERRVPPPPAPAAAPAAASKTTGGHALAAARAVDGAPNLRRALSLQVINNKTAKRGGGGVDSAISGGGKDAYIAASGNSQTITSTMATSTRSGAPSRLGGAGPIVDKRLAVLSQRTVPSMAGSSGKGGGRLMPGKLKRSVSVDAGLNTKAPPPRDEPKKPGYCENCRVKYDDFKEHVLASKHRRFAQNPKNWLELDDLLSKIRRPLLADMVAARPALSFFSSPASSVVEGDSGFFEAPGMFDCEDEEESESEEEELSEEDVSEEDESEDEDDE
ncbi:Dfp1/Him1, central region-domain-containing protein [Leucosporidium creatinivorum]|uniref:Dfp1/Him1, central region-domain-containing protein n=1 Tax=Leucosporidium creatinivorum TaxID=106004 RepID=A0A1Y2FU62_9BASI|nr:Dfp1/Him1, central region-domain-containing protein [Leucosporidium creatinivorum]